MSPARCWALTRWTPICLLLLGLGCGRPAGVGRSTPATTAEPHVAWHLEHTHGEYTVWALPLGQRVSPYDPLDVLIQLRSTRPARPAAVTATFALGGVRTAVHKLDWSTAEPVRGKDGTYRKMVRDVLDNSSRKPGTALLPEGRFPLLLSVEVDGQGVAAGQELCELTVKEYLPPLRTER